MITPKSTRRWESFPFSKHKRMKQSRYFLVTFVFFIISGLVNSVSGSNSCPVGWTKFGNDSCISISSEKSSWEEANSNCTGQNNSTQLINIRDVKEEGLLVQMLQNLTQELNRTRKYYIGLQVQKLNTSNEYNLTWTNSTNLYNFTSLHQVLNETNRTVLTVGGRVCIYFDSEVSTWGLGNCTKQARYVCQQPLPKAPESTMCKKGWHEISHFCIFVSEANISGYDYGKSCQKFDNRSYRVWINNQEKDNEIINVLKTAVKTPSEFYMGLIRYKNGIFKWTTGVMYNYTNWYFLNETTRKADKGENHLCAYYDLNYKWRLDGGCSKPRRYICQIRKRYTPVVPPPTPTKEGTSKPAKTTKNPAKTVKTSSDEPLETTTKLITVSNAKKLVDLRIKNLKGKKISEDEAAKELEATKNIIESLSIQETSDAQGAIETVEKMGEVLIAGLKKAGNITEPKQIQVQSDKMAFGVTLLPPNSSAKVQFPKNDSNGSIKIPKSVFRIAEKTPSNSDGVGMTSCSLNINSGKNADTKKPILNSDIISTKVTAVPDGTINNLDDPVVITLCHKTKLGNDDKPLCSFINTTTSEYSTAGCEVASFNKTCTVCHCRHLTSFAVLLDVHGHTEGTSDTHKFALLVISIVGCCIALVCFMASLFAFHFVISERRRRKTETISIHKNLAVAEILALVFFLLAYGVVEPKGLCFVIAFFLHYSLMAVFFWMLVEGLNLHRGTVQVFITSSRMKVYYAIGWGLPWIFVVTTAAVGQLEYAREDFCWISQQFIWAFAGPVAVILFINFVILCIAIRVMVKRPRYVADQVKDPAKRKTEHELRIAFKTTIILLPLLGLTWCLGFLASHHVTGNTIIQYLFAIVNSLQGFYFFLAHCMYDEDVRNVLFRHFCHCCRRPLPASTVINATSKTSTRVKSYFSRTLSRSNPSNSSTSNASRQPNYFKSSKRDGKEIHFEMPSVSFSTTKPKEGIPVLLNHEYIDKDGNVSSKTNDTNMKVAIHVPGTRRHRIGSTNSSSGSESGCESAAEKTQLKTFKEEDDSEIFFRRAKSDLNRLSEKTASIPRRANSVSEVERMQLSKQISNESTVSAVSGRSNTAFLSGC